MLLSPPLQLLDASVESRLGTLADFDRGGGSLADRGSNAISSVMSSLDPNQATLLQQQQLGQASQQQQPQQLHQLDAEQQVVSVNRLRLPRLTRAHHLASLRCEAHNNNVTAQTQAQLTLTMSRK